MSAAVGTIAQAGSASTEVACAHCGAGLASSIDRFCCQGCASAATLVEGLGLEAFYRKRLLTPGLHRPGAWGVNDVGPFVVQRDGACHLDLHVEGLICGACVWLVETALAREPVIERARVNFSTRRLTITWKGAPDLAQDFADLVAALGFGVAPFEPAGVEDRQAREAQELLRALAVAGFAAANVMLLSVSVWSGHAGSMGPATREFLHWLSALIALPAIAYAGLPFFRSAWRALSAGRTNMDVPISVGVSLAAAISLWETIAGRPHAFFDSAITLLFFLLIGRSLDLGARGKARAAAQHMVALTARAARVLRPDGTVLMRRPADIEVGDHVLVASGERIPVDGVVAQGGGRLDQSIVTGEAAPVRVNSGDRVYAGSINLESPLEIEMTAAGDGTLLAEIARLMEAAERGQGRYRTLADRVARLYAPVVHVAGAATFAGWYGIFDAPFHQAVMNAVAVLIITCPCALALAVPAVQVVASGRLMRRGILMKSATALERLAEVDMVVLDKTGTVTLGRPQLRAPDDGQSVVDAASMAQASRHPLARALVQACPEARFVPGVVEHLGHGLAREEGGGAWRLGSRAFCGIAAGPQADDDGALELWMVRPDRTARRFQFTDAMRPDARATLVELERRGLELRMLSGDRAAAVLKMASDLGLSPGSAEGDLRPADKVRRLQDLAAAGRKVAMIGDGLNDAPALATAHASLSPTNATDIARNAADFVVQGDRLNGVVEAIDTARMARRIARQNLTLAIGYNLLAVPLAVAGYVTPLVAAVAMSTSSILVIANALRLARGGVPS
jgi:Cu2+-exporting ATPase